MQLAIKGNASHPSRKDWLYQTGIKEQVNISFYLKMETLPVSLTVKCTD
jgi:hypothetical protein